MSKNKNESSRDGLGFMDKKTIRKSEETVEFTLSSSKPYIANAIRRFCMSKVPIFSFFDSSIHIHTNTGVLHHEIMKHRLSLIPLYRSQNDESILSYQFVINITATDTIQDVFTRDIKVLDRDQVEHPELTSFYFSSPFQEEGETSYILITKLRKDECLHVTMTAVQGTGQQHACFSPVSRCVFINTLDQVQIDAKKNELSTIEEQKQFEIHEKYRHFIMDKENNPTSFDFMIDSLGQYPSYQIVYEAIHQLHTSLETMIKTMTPILSQSITDHRAAEFAFTDIDHGIANLIQGYCYDHYQDKLQYIGYHKPHPLNSTIVFRMVPIVVQQQGEGNEEKEKETFLDDCRHVFQQMMMELHEKVGILQEQVKIRVL